MEYTIRNTYLGLALTDAIISNDLMRQKEKIWNIFLRTFIRKYKNLKEKLMQESYKGGAYTRSSLNCKHLYSKQSPYGLREMSLHFSTVLLKLSFNDAKFNNVLIDQNKQFAYIDAYSDNRTEKNHKKHEKKNEKKMNKQIKNIQEFKGEKKQHCTVKKEKLKITPNK